MKKIIAFLLSLMLLASCAIADVPAEEEKAPGAMAQLVQAIARELWMQPQTLDIDLSHGYWKVEAVSKDGKTIEITMDDLRAAPISIILDGEGVLIASEGVKFSYSKLADMLVFGDEDANILQQLITTAPEFNEGDLNLLRTAGELAYAELKKAGALPTVQEGYDETRFTLSITPALIETAALRFIEGMLEHEAEIDSLLTRAEPLLRELFPDLYTVRDRNTGETTQRESLSCADLKALYTGAVSLRKEDYDTLYDGIHIDISGFFGDEDWRIDGSYLDPEYEIAALLELSGDDEGGFEGALEYCEEHYNSDSRSSEYVTTRFDISGRLHDSGFTLRVRPEKPLEGFTMLNIDYFEGYDSIIIDAVTDMLDFRLELGDTTLDISAVMPDFLLELHLQDIETYPSGTLTLRDYARLISRYSASLDVKLNSAE